MWKVPWFYEKVHNLLVVLLYYYIVKKLNKISVSLARAPVLTTLWLSVHDTPETRPPVCVFCIIVCLDK